jgi:hypothetical protein
MISRTVTVMRSIPPGDMITPTPTLAESDDFSQP